MLKETIRVLKDECWISGGITSCVDWHGLWDLDLYVHQHTHTSFCVM